MGENIDYAPNLMLAQPGQSKNMKTQECYLQGSIFNQFVDQLHDRLQGLCDNVPPETFREHERTYMMKNPNGTAQTVKVCQAFGKTKVPFQLKYVGLDSSSGRNKLSMTRSIVTVACNKDPVDFLKELGFVLQFETQTNGTIYKKKISRGNSLKIIVAKLMSKQNFELNNEHLNNSHMVEVSAPSQQHESETVSQEVRNFALALRPIVMVDKLEQKQMQMACR